MGMGKRLPSATLRLYLPQNKTRAKKVFGVPFFKKAREARSAVIIKLNLIKRDYVQRDYNLILFCDKVVLGLYFSVRTEKYEKSRLRGDSMSPLKNLLSQKGGIPFETLAKHLSSRYVGSERARLRFVMKFDVCS